MTKKIPLTSNYSFSELAAAIRGREPFNKRAKLTDAEIMEMLKISEQFLADKMLKLTKKSEGGLLDEGGEKDPVSGNKVPAGSTKKEVRDDIPAQLSEGEFVFPADVVRYLGLDFLMKLRQKAKAGLKRMEEMGQMGNSEEATLPDDIPFTLDDLDVEEDGRLNFSEGGVADEEAGVFGKPTDTEDDEDDEASFDDLIGGGSFGKYDELRKFVGPDGEIRYIPFKDGEPLPPYKDILEGLTEKGYTYTPPGEEDDKKPPEEQMPVEEVKEEKDREKEQQTAKEDKERSERSLDNAVQQAIEAGMKSEKDIIDWIKGGNVKVGKFKVPGFLYNNIPLPGQEFGPITNAINRNPNVQQGFDIKEPLPEPKPTTSTQTDEAFKGVKPEVGKKLRTNLEDIRTSIQEKKKQKVIDNQIANYEKEAGIAQQSIESKDEQIDEFQKELQEAMNELNQKETEIANKNAEIENKNAQLAEKDAQITKSQQQIQEQNNRLSQLSSKTGSAAPNVIKTDQGTTFTGGKLTTDNKGNIIKVDDKPVIVQDDRDRDRPSGSGTSFKDIKPDPQRGSDGGGSLGGGDYGGIFNIGGLASKKPKKKKKVMKRGGLASKK